MLKGFCLITIIASASLGGIYFSSMLKDRVIFLKKINCMLEEIFILLKYRSATVYEITETLSRDERFSGLDFLGDIKFSAEKSFCRSWCEAVEEHRYYCLKNSDRELLMDIGRNLGTSELEGQLGAVRSRQAELESIISAAEDEYRRKARLYRSLGVLAGVFIALILV